MGGIALGLAVVGMIAALGVAELIQASDMLYEGLRWAGVLFLFYLAWEGWTTGTDVVSSSGISHGKYFARGLVTNLLNPKAAVFYVAVLPTFVEPDRPILMQTLMLSAVYVAVATIVHATIVLLAGTLEPFLNDPRRERIARRVLSSLSCGCGVMVRLVDSALGSMRELSWSANRRAGRGSLYQAASARHFAHVPRNSMTAFLATKPVEPTHSSSCSPTA